MNIIKVKKGTVIFNQGDASDSLYCLTGQKGAVVGIYSGFGTPHEELLTEVLVDQLFGEMGAFTGSPRSATAVALTDAELEKVEKADLKDYVKTHPTLLLSVMKTSSETLRRLTRDYTDACVTVSDYVEACSIGEPISEDLKERLEKYVKD